MDSLELPKKIFTLGEEPFPIKSITYHTYDSKLFSAVKDALHDDEYEELKESRLGLNIKKKYELWSLVDADPMRFSLIEFEQLTGLNCEYIEHLENPRCEVTNEMAIFWERIGVSIDAGFIEGRKYSSATRASLARLIMDLEKFDNYPWGRVAFKVLMDSLRAKDFTKSYTVDGFIQVLQVWINHALPELGANYGNPLPNKPSPPLLASKGDKGHKCFKDAISRQLISPNNTTYTRVINYVAKNSEEMFPKWDNDREDVSVENIIQVMFNAPPNWKWTMKCKEDENIYPWTNPKMHVVYVKEESSVKSLVMKLLGNKMDVMEKKLRITGKRTSSDDLQQTTSNLPKKGLEHGSESVNRAKARQDEEPSSSKALSVEAKEKEVKEGKEKELKEKITKGLEKALVKAKEAKANEAKAKEAKAKEAKAKEKERPDSEMPNRRKRPKPKRLLIKCCLLNPRRVLKASVVVMNKEKNTVSDLKMQEAKRLLKKDFALAVVRGRSERARKLAATKQSPFQGNSTTKLIIPNTKVGHGYDLFALPDKQLSKALTEHLKKDSNWQKSFERKLKRYLSYSYQVIRTPSMAP
ncbi:hypothetical protein N665_0310s0004 [Sinapis alba]|nr:hypothetical protein N665_0310s0004 [Sinapis alba]